MNECATFERDFSRFDTMFKLMCEHSRRDGSAIVVLSKNVPVII